MLWLQRAIPAAWTRSTTALHSPSSLPACPGPASRIAPSRACVHSATLPLCHPGIILCWKKKKKSPNRKQKSTFQLLLPPQVNTKHLPGDVELRADSRRVQPSFTSRSSAYKPWPIGCSPRIYSPTKPVIPERGILVKQELCVVLLACYS